MESLTQTDTSLNEKERLQKLYEASVYDAPKSRILKYFGDESTVFGVVCKKHFKNQTQIEIEITQILYNRHIHT